MATDPAFAATVNVGSGQVSGTADTNLTAPTTAVSIVTAGSNGTKIESIRFVGVGNTVAGLVNVFRYDGTNYRLVDQVTVTAVTVSATVSSFLVERQYPNLWLKSGDSLRVSSTATSNNVMVTAFGADF